VISFLSVRRGDRPDYLKFDRSTIRNDQPGGPFVHFLAPRTRGEEKEKEEHVSRETLIRAGHVAPPSIGVKPLNREGSRPSLWVFVSPSIGDPGGVVWSKLHNHSVLHEIPRKQSPDDEQPSRAERRPQSTGFAGMLGLEDRVVEEPPRDDFLTLRLHPR
jgi:hypothetical protein